MRDLLRHRPSYALVVSVLAIICAFGGTAWAAATLTGANIRNSSLTHKDFKNEFLSTTDMDVGSRTTLREKGSTGPAGPKGATGDTGNKGTTGDKGTPAKNAFAWAYNVQQTMLPAMTSSNEDPDDWFPTQAGTGEWTNPDAGFGGVRLELAAGKNDGLLVLERESDVVASAHITGWHEDAAVHSRLECRLRITNISTNQQATIGQPVLVSTKEFRHVTDVGLVGGIRRAAGSFEVKVECRDLDLASTGYDKWFIVKGNLSVLSAGNWR